MFLLIIDSVLSNEDNVKDKQDDIDGVKTWTIAAQLLLPLATLAILWGKKRFFTKLFLQFDKSCISVICPSLSKQQRLLKWASSRLYANCLISSPIDFWKDGSLLCTLINSAIPGACSNPHRHWKRPPSHGQLLAYKYLGITPVFTENELGEPLLSLKNEKLLIQYLTDIQQAISKMSPQDFKYSSYYVARGMGLVVGEQHRKAVFYIYPYSRKSSNKHDIFVNVKGPFNTTSSATIPGKFTSRNTFTTNLIDKKRLTYQTKAQKLFFRSFSVDFGSFIYPNRSENDVNYIPMRITSEKDRVKLVYIPKNNGIYEISIIVNGFHLLGSPFSVSIADNTSKIYDTFSDSNSDSKKDRGKSIKRRVISKIIDFIDEKITYSSETKSAQINISDSSMNSCVLTNIRELNHDEYEIVNQSSSQDAIGIGSSSSTSSDFNNNKLLSNKRSHFLDDEDKHIYDDVPLEDYDNEGINSGRPTSRNAIVDVLADFHIDDFDTSPICENNIENEVSDKNFEPRAHKRSKMSLLQRQDNIPDVVSNDNKLIATEESLQDELVQSLLADCKETKKYLDDNEKFNNERKNIPKPKKRNIFYKSNSMEILNVLSKLKDKTTNSNLNKSNLKNLTTSNISLNEYKRKCFQNEVDKSCAEQFPNLRERVLYWESLINLNILETTKSCKHRNSLPNLFASSETENPDITYNKSVDFKTQFKKRHEYWKVLSSQAESCSSLRSSIDYLCNRTDNNITNRRSLPELYYNYFTDYNNFDFKSSIDFYDSEDVEKFRIKFRECKNYWERLCSNQECYDELYYIDRNSIIQEVNLDGGFSTSVPDLLIKNSNFSKASFLNAYNLKDLYKIRKDYWEALCLYETSDDSNINTSFVTNLERDQFLNFDRLTNNSKSKINNVYNTN